MSCHSEFTETSREATDIIAFIHCNKTATDTENSKSCRGEIPADALSWTIAVHAQIDIYVGHLQSAAVHAQHNHRCREEKENDR